MNSSLRGALWALFFSLTLALFAGLVAPWFGLLVFTFLLLAQLVAHLHNIAKLERWSREPKIDETLTGFGVWAGIFSRLYRHEKKIGQAIVRHNEEIQMFISAAQALADGVLVLDKHHRILFCNHIAERQLNLSSTEDREHLIIDLIRTPKFVNYMQGALFNEPLQLVSETGEAIFAIHVIPYAGDNKLLQIKDITQTERVDAMRRDFVANVSHELRTPLTVLAGFVESLLEMDLSKEDTKKYLKLMGEQSARMEHIVEDLLNLSTIESAPPPNNGIIDMPALIEKITNDAKALSNGKHSLFFEVDESLNLLGAPTEILSACMNLVSNAVRYTQQNGTIKITWKRSEKEGAQFSVSDQGIGIEAKHISRLTERFYRVDRSRSRETGGTGLGLSIVKHIVQRHQATLRIESAPRVGSSFAIDFPKERVAPTEEINVKNVLLD